MSRHPIDHQAPSGGGRTRNFTEVERRQGEEGSHPASQALNRRPRGERSSRTSEFTRIERGKEA